MHFLSSPRLAALSFAALLVVSAACGQTAASGNSTVKVGVVNMMQAISSTAEGKQAASELQSQFLSRQQELDSLNKQLEDVQQRLNGQPRPSGEEGARLSVQANRLAQRIDRKKNEYQEDINSAQTELVNAIGGKMMEVLNRYAQENGFVTVLDSSAQNSPVLFASKASDITEEIVRLYDQAHPVKTAAAPATKPAPALPAPKPGSTAPKPH